MKAYLSAILLPFVIVVSTVAWTHGRFRVIWLREWIAIALLLLIIPLVSAAVAATLIHNRAPRQWIARGGSRTWLTMIAGLFAGCLALGITGASVSIVNRDNWYELAWPTSFAVSDSYYVVGSEFILPGESDQAYVRAVLPVPYYYLRETDRPLMRSPIGPEGMVTGVATFVSVVLVTSLLPKRRPGVCIRCGYDIRFSLDSGICPECGTAISPGV